MNIESVKKVRVGSVVRHNAQKYNMICFSERGNYLYFFSGSLPERFPADSLIILVRVELVSSAYQLLHE